MHYFSWLSSPWLIFASVITGALIGFFDQALAFRLMPFGTLYLKLLQMLVAPIILTAVITGLGNLLISGIKRQRIVKLLLFLIIGLLLASLIGALFGYLGKPGTELQQDAKVTLGRTIIETEASEAHKVITKNQTPALLDFISAMIPDNIFDALTRGDNPAILFFAILVGIAMGFINSSSSKVALEVVGAFFDVFLSIISWLMYLLPFGLLCLFAGQLAQVGTEILWASAKLVLFIYLASLMSMFCYSLIIWWKLRNKLSYMESLAALRSPLLIALGTASSFATIPASLYALKNNLKIDKNICDLIIPLGTTLNPPASVLQFAISSIFIAQLYNFNLGLDAISLILLGSILAGIAASGAPSVVALSMIAITLEPLGQPTSVAVILLVAIDPIVDPIITALNVHANCALTVVMADTQDQERQNFSQKKAEMGSV